MGLDDHPRVIVSEPSSHPHEVVLVGTTEWDSEKDTTCILLAGEYGFSGLKKKSIVYYALASIATAAALQEGIAAGKILIWREKMPEPLILRILEGFMDSESRAPPAVCRALEAQGIIAWEPPEV